ncbi:beta strand repeat-containing protein, partial [Helicobacter pullorum]|uniref:beta strand repeat-containing protein n=1 Tax=Helicobacter pullorum TaxID=35818 RepID=UPI000A7505A5
AKIQRVKNTSNSITIQNPTNSQKSKESSKVKSLIRTIPVSIALASALTSHAVADIRAEAGGVIKDTATGSIINEGTINNQKMQNAAVSGNNGTIINATIVNGTIVSGTSNTAPSGGNVNANGNAGSIINGWNFRDGGNGTLGNNGTVVVGQNFNTKSMAMAVLIGKAGDLLVDTGVVIRGGGGNGGVANGVILVGQNTQAGTITNKGTLNNGNKNIAVGNNAITEAIINEGVININNFNGDSFGIMGGNNSTIKTIINTGTMNGAASNGFIRLNGSAVETLLLKGGLLNHTNNGKAISIFNGASVDNIAITNGASIKGSIDMQNTSNVGTMVISGANNSGTATQITGDINIANTSTITNGITLSDTANITGNINLTDRGYIDTLSLNQGTITGGISLTGNADGTGTNTATIGEITLTNTSTITGNISVKGDGASNNANAKIGNITLEDGTGIGGSIAVGDSGSNTNGVITGITLNGNSTIAGGIINNTNGNIGTITSNTGTNINNIITNHGTIGSLEVNNQGTIVYRSDSGIITDTLSVAEGATLDIKDSTGSNTGTIELRSNSLELEDGSTLNLANGSTLVGHLKNSGNLGDWTNKSNIQGHFINEGTIGELNAGNIAEYLQNSGVIKILKQGQITGTLNNTGTIGELNTSVINYTNGNTNTATIAGAGHYGILNIDKNTIMDNNNTITNALKVDKNNSGNGYTLTINNGGSGGNGTIYINFGTDAQVGTINNLGTILGSIDNQTSSTIKTFNTGSISGSIINNANATIETLNVTGNVTNGIRNDSNIGSLIVEESVSYSGNGSDRITQALIVEKDKTLTAGSGITFNSTNGTINNAGTINGNITNIADSILTDFTNSGSISGTFTNEGHIVKFVNTDTGNINTFTNNNTISFFENNGTIANFGGTGTIYGVINSKTITNGFENVATSLWNKENALISGNVALKGDYKDCTDSGGTICKTSDLINEGTITGNVTNDTGKEINLVENTGTIGGSIANSGSINTLEVSGTIANGITNNSNIGTFIVNESVNYNGNGSDRITQALEVAKDKTLTIQNNGTLSFNSKNGNVNNLGTIAGNLSNVSNSTLGTFINSGTINGNINNEGTITSINNSGVITGEIVSGSSGQTSQIDKIINTGTIGTAKTKVATFKTLVASNQNVSSNFNDAISLNTITTTEISNGGLVNGNIRVKGQSDIQELNNTNTIDGCIILEGGRIGNINNTNGAIANCMHFSNGADVGGLNNDGTISGTITNNSGNITIDNSGSISGITTSNGGTTNISNGGFKNSGGNIGLITNTGSNSTTNIIEWNVGNPDNPKSPIKVAGDNLGGINTGKIYLDNVQGGKIYDTGKIVTDEDGNPSDSNGNLADQLNNGQGIFDSLDTISGIVDFTDEGGGKFSAGIDTQELSGKTLGASLIYSSRMRQINTNSMLREINVKNFKTDFEILEQRERLKNQQALLENYKQQRESYLNGLTKDNKELKRVSSKESTSLSTYANNSNIKSDAIEVVDYYNKDTLASLDNLQATTKANQETYSNLDLLRELDDIFISHTGDKDNLYTFALPYTRYTSAQLDGGVGTLKSHASGILAGAQAKLPSERGILGIYFGYESSDKQVGQQRLDFDEKVYYGGLTYYNVFARKGV